MKKLMPFLVLLIILSYIDVSAKIKVVTSTPDLADFAGVVGGDKVDVSFIVRGTQNPHYIEVKPSYMMKLKSADIFIIIGLQLEIWYQQIVDGSRNAKLLIIDCSKNIEKLEVPTFKVDASYGDVHPFGNPHYWLDPENVIIILQEILAGFASISPSDLDYFKVNMDNYLKKLETKMGEWKKLSEPFNGRQFVTYHTSFSYFVNRFGFSVAGYVEPKPGIPPTPSHTIELITLMRNAGIKVIGLEPFYDDSVPKKIAESTGAQLVTLPTSVGGVPDARDYISLIDYNIRTLINAFSGK